MYNEKVLFIVGTTASGKSSLAMALAKKLDGEIIAADSQTVRKELNIGTAKPTKQDMAEIRHHLIDVIEPYGDFSVAQFQKLAKEAISDIQARGKLPIVVGGTGLYIDSIYYDYSLNSHNIVGRDELNNLSVEELQKIIADKGLEMPNNSQNPRHLIGVISRGGKNSEDNVPMKNSVIVGLSPDGEILKQRISDRVDNMFDSGFLDEVKSIINRHGPLPDRIGAIGYPIASRVLSGEISEDEAKELFKSADWQYARRQKSWFKRNENIIWIPNSRKAVSEIIEQLNKK